MAVTIGGYILAFDDRADLGRLQYERFARNSIINNRAPLRIAHSRAVGSTFAWADLSQNEYGYRIEATVADCNNASGIARVVRGGCDCLSMSFRSIAERKNGPVSVIERARLTEISIVPQGAYASARCWIAGPDLQYAPPAIRALVARWDEPERIEYTTGNIQKAAPFPAADYDDDDDEEETVTQVADFMWITETRPKSRPKAQHDPVRQAVQRHMLSYLERYSK